MTNASVYGIIMNSYAQMTLRKGLMRDDFLLGSIRKTQNKHFQEEKHTMGKRALSLFLAVMLCVSMLPTAVFADTSGTFETVETSPRSTHRVA